MSIKIYKDTAANSIFIEDANGAQFLNSLQATVPIDKINIRDLARQIDIVSNADHTDFVDENDSPYTGTAIDVCNQLNAIFQSSGTPTGEPPEITSPLTINSVEGSTINYELTANFGVGYEWDLSNVSGITNVEGNPRKLIGGSSLATGTYNIPVKAINYNGEDSETIVLTVSNPPFSNTKSVRFNQNDYLIANGGIVQNVFGRSGNGSGASDAWTMSFWFKAGSSSNQSQTIFYTGSSNLSNNHHIRIYWNGNNVLRQSLVLQYGSNNNNLKLETPVGSLSNDGLWHHYVITYDGGTTGSSSGQLNNYYSRFKIFIDGSQQSTNNTNSNFGTSTGLTTLQLQIAKLASSNTLRNNCKIDEWACWDSNQSSNVSSIYNGGSPTNLSLLAQPPVHWSRMGDGDSYPNLLDSGTAASLVWVMQFMTAADIVNDVP
jgi:hypothetical protein